MTSGCPKHPQVANMADAITVCFTLLEASIRDLSVSAFIVFDVESEEKELWSEISGNSN